MATFSVGDRVRVVAVGATAKHLMGAEATIVAPYAEYFVAQGRTMGYLIRTDYEATEYVAWPEHIEPIQPERNQVIEWSECLWQPEHMGEPA